MLKANSLALGLYAPPDQVHGRGTWLEPSRFRAGKLAELREPGTLDTKS
jgi:hypothetical protein